MVITSNTHENEALKESGSKGFSLYRLTRENVRVPAWVILGKSLFNQFLEYSEIRHIIENALIQIVRDSGNPDTITSAVILIRKVILEAAIPGDMYQEILSAYDSLPSHQIVVRSSVVTKNECLSFAGQHQSFLFISDTVKLINSIKECWISAFSTSAINYRIAHKLEITASSFEIAVILQEMIFPLKSGLITTSDLLTGDSSGITINASYGLGTGIQRGIADTDTYKVIKETDRISLLSIITKTSQALVNQTMTAVERRPVPDNLKSASCLSYQEIIDLARLAKKLEHIYKSPILIEWAWTNQDGFSLLQVNQIKQTENASSHSSEQYSGADNKNQLTYPLNFGFIRHVSHNSFLQLCKAMHMSKKQISKLDPYLENILSSIFGRTYYNVLNLYRLTSVILPAKRARNAYLGFTTGQHGFDKSHFDKSDSLTGSAGISGFRRLVSNISFIRYHLFFDRFMKRFQQKHDQFCNYFCKLDFLSMSASDIYSHYKEFEKSIFSNWKAPAINNYLSMVYFRAFRFLTTHWFGSASSQLLKDLLYVKSVPLSDTHSELSKITEFIKQSDMLQNDDDLLSDPVLPDAINSHESIHSRLSVSYADAYHKQTGSHSGHDRQSGDERCLLAEKSIDKKLHGIRSIIYRKSLELTRNTIKNRVLINSYKSRIYAVVKVMFNGIGADLCRHGLIDKSDDIFYLDFKMLPKLFSHNSVSLNLRKTIVQRKEQYNNFSRMEPPSRIITNGPIYWLNQTESSKKSNKSITTSNQIRGNGVCGGVAEGAICMSYQVAELSKDTAKIIVLSGFYPEYSMPDKNIRGVIIENSNHYSNYALVARELGIPVITGVKNAGSRLRSGMLVKMDAKRGTIAIIENASKISNTDSFKPDELV
ncbi:MAG: PEP/pyruvate-binding domain-containing protein, partial [Fibrobacterota bacterium]